MKNKLLIAAIFVTTFAVLLHRFEKPVMAQVRAALVKNIDERGRSPYSLGFYCVPLPGSNFCQGAAASPVPANKRFVVEYLNGNFGIDGAPTGGSFLGGLTNSLALDPHLIQSSFGFYSYVVNMPVVAYYEPGQTPSIQFLSTLGGAIPSGAITLNGYLVDLSE